MNVRRFWIVCVAVLAGCGGERAPSTAAVASSTVSVSTAASPSMAARWIARRADTWQWQLSGAINTAYPAQVFDIDLFDAPQPTIDKLKAQGSKVVCYFSAG